MRPEARIPNSSHPIQFQIHFIHEEMQFIFATDENQMNTDGKTSRVELEC
jgi:hypothetical protein